MCQRCEELEEEVAYLKSELGMTADVERSERLRRVLRAHTRNSHAGSAERLILTLYAARGRVMAKWAIMQAIPPQDGGEDERQTKIVDVWVFWARRGLGADAIENAWGRGYRMTDAGMERVRAILEPEPESGQAFVERQVANIVAASRFP